jgi:hypothetical protein
MTIDRGAIWRRAARACALVALLGTGWTAANAGILLWTERADAVMAVFPHGMRLPEGVAMLAWDGRVAQLAPAGPGYVTELYRQGALIVLPVRRHSCLAMTRPTA